MSSLNLSLNDFTKRSPPAAASGALSAGLRLLTIDAAEGVAGAELGDPGFEDV